MKKVLFVCMGNICRSPTAEAVFRKLVQQTSQENDWQIDSAGTHAYHVGEKPDQRSRQAARQRAYNLEGIRARQVHADDFFKFDWILAADKQNLHALQSIQPPNGRAQLALMQDFASKPEWRGSDVPDPYYGGVSGFDDVLNRLEDACQGFLQHSA
jgi:protein-tyrosine phosphatase